MEPQIPKHDPRYRNIRPEELPPTNLPEQETETIRRLKRGINSHANGCARMCVLIAVLSFYCVFFATDFMEASLEAFLTGLFVGLGFFLAAGLCLRGRIPKHAAVTHAQYGIVNGKWPSPARSGNTNGRTYYLDVIFPDTGTRIQKVVCDYKDYKRVEQGQQVLAVVFEKRNQAFGTLLSKS